MVRFEVDLIFLRIAVRGPDETPVRAPKALVLILVFFCYEVMLSNSISLRMAAAMTTWSTLSLDNNNDNKENNTNNNNNNNNDNNENKQQQQQRR